MKKIKLLIILLVCIMLTACKQEYNLIIDDNKIIEEYNAVVEDNEESKERLKLDYYPIHADETKKYNKKITKENNMLNVHFDYTYSPEEFSNANSFNQCFSTKEVVLDDENFYYFRLGNIGECMTDYNLDINIITKNKVLNHNADKVRGNKYTWHLKEKDKEKFYLEIMIKKGKKNYLSVENIISISVVLIFAILLTIFVLLKKKKVNKI